MKLAAEGVSRASRREEPFRRGSEADLRNQADGRARPREPSAGAPKAPIAQVREATLVGTPGFEPRGNPHFPEEIHHVSENVSDGGRGRLLTLATKVRTVLATPSKP
jgi:hypothetical protein